MSIDSSIVKEAERCLQCKNPLCRQGCPNKTEISEMIQLLLSGNIADAGNMLFENNPLSAICSIICPHEKFCEGHCVLGRKGEPVKISKIEKAISDQFLKACLIDKADERKLQKVAVIGSGPAGLTVAIKLATAGYNVTIFESEEKIGGILQYGIPDFRLSKDILKKIKNILLKLDVKNPPQYHDWAIL